MIIQSDWHIHSEYSYDATLPLAEIAQKASEYGFQKIGITDHLNFNDEKFLSDLRSSAKHVNEFQKSHPEMILGVELNPFPKPIFDYIAKTGTRDGYIAPVTGKPFEIAIALTKEELMTYGVRYAVGAAHGRLDNPGANTSSTDMDALIKEWHRQQIWLACNESVTILGHPWDHEAWHADFSVIPHSIHDELAAALKENGKYVECNSALLSYEGTSEKFRMQYAEYLRELFEKGVRVTYGSDAHRGEYAATHLEIEKYLASAGFVEGDFSEVADEDLW